MKIAIVDDHPIFREGLRVLLHEAIPSSEIDLYADGDQFLTVLTRKIPTLAFVDIDLPGMDGITICKEVKKLVPSVHVVILTMHKELSLIKSAMNAGASGFVVKENSALEIAKCCETVLHGEKYITKTIDESELSGYMNNVQVGNNVLNELLTKTERQILSLIGDKKTSKEIADILFVTSKSVEIYRSRICKKLGLSGKKNSLLVWTMENIRFLDELEDI